MLCDLRDCIYIFFNFLDRLPTREVHEEQNIGA